MADAQLLSLPVAHLVSGTFYVQPVTSSVLSGIAYTRLRTSHKSQTHAVDYLYLAFGWGGRNWLRLFL